MLMIRKIMLMPTRLMIMMKVIKLMVVTKPEGYSARGCVLVTAAPQVGQAPPE